MELQKIDLNLVRSIKDALSDMRPSKDIAPRWFGLRSVMKSEAAEKFTKALTQHLLECKDCDELEVAGIQIKKVTPKESVYFSTPEVLEAQKEVDRLTESLKKAKAELQGALDRAGFEQIDGNPYYKVVQ